jgi:uncharacterized NAD-dependent epimerase/dehydratase family protein
MLEMPGPFLLFLADVTDRSDAKTAFGLADWAPDRCIGQHRLPGCAVDCALPDMVPRDAVARGAQSIVIGVAPAGGALPDAWIPALLNAMDEGLHVISGLHQPLAAISALVEKSAQTGRRLIEIRAPTRNFPLATGQRRTGKRLLTVGTDCALGKKYTALAIHRAMAARGVDCDFRATGQTGLMLASAGVAIDAVVADFVAGAAEWLSPAADLEHWDLIEGQGALLHPAYAGVTLGLLHGSQPDFLVLCHDPTRTHLVDFPDFAIPTLDDAIMVYEKMARVTNPDARVVAISLNTSRLPPSSATDIVVQTQRQTGLICFDPMRGGIEELVDYMLESR